MLRSLTLYAPALRTDAAAVLILPFVLLLGFAGPARAQVLANWSAPASVGQQSAQDGDPQQDDREKEKDKDKEKAGDVKAQASGTSNDRLFWTLPNFLTVENMQNVPPLTARVKFEVVTRTSFDIVEIPWYGLLAGVGQAQNSQPEFGQGAKGYAKRFGTAFADGTIDNFMVGAVFPAVLRQDPRYYQLGTGGIWHRTGYSLSRLLITRSDSGHHQFNFSEVLGSAVTAGISNVYHSSSDRTAANSIAVWWSQVGYDAIAVVVKEFWPDIRRKLSKN
jgi:hypothetical protein